MNMDRESPVEMFKGDISLAGIMRDCHQLSTVHSMLSAHAPMSVYLSGASVGSAVMTAHPTVEMTVHPTLI